MNRKERLCIFSLLIALVISLLFLDFLHAKKGLGSHLPWRKLLNYTKASLKIESAINRCLVDLDVKQKDLIKEFWEEKEKEGNRWVVVTKHIRIPPEKSLNEFYENISESVRRAGGRIIDKKISKTSGRTSLSLTIGCRNIITHHLTLSQTPLKQDKE